MRRNATKCAPRYCQFSFTFFVPLGSRSPALSPSQGCFGTSLSRGGCRNAAIFAGPRFAPSLAQQAHFAPARVNRPPMNIRVALDGNLDLESKLDARTLTIAVIGM